MFCRFKLIFCRFDQFQERVRLHGCIRALPNDSDFHSFIRPEKAVLFETE